ncbi:NADH-FMN oxidoreductase RutF, flavin reductase (DIM6/NTAB) family [Dyadobacter soli]|uniref:NADH-FMN oxidoreductase RutF, flavin reductase (DIM6/NTAB) family n=1 Tax=Dyadobacter soli TaxID=659014 RepID=A0A1G7GBE6_9BACT|nr:flavin reductase family protein [Dyadobacter soli]SDE85474.1 NADH-FMN oxidoreductase RutF, flavin reductase (DIM6/NTAB) family [Dyadobacter soli]
MHQISNPSILYFGTPVVLVGTTNVDDTFNLAPISSAFWLGYRCMIGIAAHSKTTENILRTRECVLNLPSVEQVEAVDRLALLTGSNPVPAGKKLKGYTYEADKFGRAGLTPLESTIVSAPRVLECPVQLEAAFVAIHPFAAETGIENIRSVTLELKILRVHLDDSIVSRENPDHVDPEKWRPLIMSFQQFYGLGGQLHPSKLASVPERLYRTRDTESAGISHLDLN